MKSRHRRRFGIAIALLWVGLTGGCRREVPPPPPPPPMPSSGMLLEPENREAAWNSTVRWSSHHNRLALIERRGARFL